MRLAWFCLAALFAASPSMAQIITPGSPLLRTDRIHPYTDTISLIAIPKDSAQRTFGTLVRRVEAAHDGGVAVFRETQRYAFVTGEVEVDTPGKGHQELIIDAHTGRVLDQKYKS